MMSVTGLAHLRLIDRLGRMNVSFHEVQQLQPIVLGSLRRLKRGSLVTGNDYSFNKFQSGLDYVLGSAWLPGRPVDTRRLAKSPFRSRKLTRYAGPRHGGLFPGTAPPAWRGGIFSPVLVSLSAERLTFALSAQQD
jgi:hypothetical protein